MRLYPDTKVYVLCPGNYNTGGPESLHQLCSKLIEFRINAAILYIQDPVPLNAEDPVHEFYKKYHAPYTLNLEDKPHNVLIVPEYYSEYLYAVKNIRRVLWWMSVGNYLDKVSLSISYGVNHALESPLPKFFYFHEADGDIEHWGQSEYVRQFLRLNGVTKIKNVQTHMQQNFLKRAAQVDLLNKKNIVAYSPRKGFEITEQLIRLAPDIDWRPIQNMTPAQVQNLLLRAKVYIDFGDFPGRERLPREAALSGCVVITGKRGAAANDVDINIPAEFKFDLETSKPYQVIEKILEVFDNFRANYDKQRAFREKELNAQRNFTLEVAEAFGIENFPAPTVALTQGVSEESFRLAAELFKSADFAPRFIVDDFFATAEISHDLILREQNRSYLRVGENFIEIITRDDAKFLYWEGRIKLFALLEPAENELDELQNFYAPDDNNVLIFER